MGCFLVPAGGAVITTIAAKMMKSKENSSNGGEVRLDEERGEWVEKIPFSEKLNWLNKLLWGGSVLLAFEHVWHGEVVPWFPFLTAANDPADTAEMLHEMSTAGVTMAILTVAVWVGMLIVSALIEKRTLEALPAQS